MFFIYNERCFSLQMKKDLYLHCKTKNHGSSGTNTRSNTRAKRPIFG